MSNRLFWTLTSLAVVCAAAISLSIGLQQSPWFDEIYSVDLARQSWGDIVRLTAEDVHPPLYYWLLKGWSLLFGTSELALRSLSVLFLGGSVAVMALLLRRLFGIKTALVALPFIVFAPFLLRYGFEIRMYTLVSFMGVAATYIFVIALEEKVTERRRMLLAVYGLLVALSVYTLYFMALVWTAHLVWLLLQYRWSKERTRLLEAGAAYVGAFLLFLPWLPSLLRGATGGTLSPVTHALNSDGLLGIVTYSFLYRPPWELGIIDVMVISTLIVSVIFLGVTAYKAATKREQRGLLLLWLYVAVPIAVLLVVTQFLPIYLERYIAHFIIALYAVIGASVGIVLRRHAVRALLPGGIVLAVLITGCVSLAGYGNYNFQRLHTPSIKQAATLLGDCKKGAIIFADGPQIAVELMYYVEDCPVYFFNETLEMTGGFAMISNSPHRVASAADLPATHEILHVYYNEPKNVLLPVFVRQSVTTHEKVSVAVYRLEGYN